MNLLRGALIVGLGVGVIGAAAIACGANDFDSQTKVNSVRMFGVRPDKPFAKPGEIVTLEALTADGRQTKTRPLKVFWIPLICVNPREDFYYLCFVPSTLPDGTPIDGGTRLVPAVSLDAGAGGVDAGAIPPGAGGITSIAQIPSGIDLTPFLPQGSSFSFRMPDDIVQPRLGTPPYGLAIVFNIACAGQVRFIQREGNSPQQIPIQCTDEEGNALGPDDFVIGINRVYSYPDRTNTNPVVEQITLDGGVVDPAAGFNINHCTASRRSDCPTVSLGVKVSDSSWEDNPSPGNPVGQREQVWVAYYSDIGDFAEEARLLFDSKKGRVDLSDIEYRAPYKVGEGTVWAVVHDNRAGAAFVVVPVHIK